MGIFVPKDAEFKNPTFAALGRVALGLFVAVELIALLAYLSKDSPRPAESQGPERTAEMAPVDDLTDVLTKRGRLGTVSLRGGNPSPADEQSDSTGVAPTQEGNPAQASGGATGTNSTSESSSSSSSTDSQSAPPPSTSSDGETQSSSGGGGGTTEPSGGSTGGSGGGGAGGGDTEGEEGSESEEGGNSGGGGAGP